MSAIKSRLLCLMSYRGSLAYANRHRALRPGVTVTHLVMEIRHPRYSPVYIRPEGVQELDRAELIRFDPPDIRVTSSAQ
jgi:hypothetical protein